MHNETYTYTRKSHDTYIYTYDTYTQRNTVLMDKKSNHFINLEYLEYCF